MAWTAPATWSVSEIVTASKMNLHVRDNFSYLKSSPTFDGTPTMAGGQMLLKAVSQNNNQIRFQNSAGTNKTAIGSDINTNTGANTFEVFDLVASALRLIVADGGNLGIGVATPQGRLHGYDTISGFMHWKFDGVDGTARTVVPDGTGDVLYLLGGMGVTRTSGGATAATSFLGASAIAPGGAQVLYSAGGDTCALQVAANGAITVQRTAGALTYKVGLWLLWL